MNRLAVWMIAAVMLPDAAMAALRVWPSATCAATLQACIDGAASGDELVVETLAPIQEDLSIVRSLHLHARGFAANLGPGRSLTVTAQVDGADIRIGNFRISGAVVVDIGSSNAAHTQTVELRGLLVRPLAGIPNPVRFVANPGTQSSYTATLAQSRVFETGNPGSINSVAVRFEHAIGSGRPTFNLIDNQIMSFHDGVHFSIYAPDSNAFAHGNRIGRYRRTATSAVDVVGLQMLSGATATPAPRMRVQRNQIFHFNTAMRFWGLGHLNGNVRNNTVAWIRTDGIRLERAVGTTLTAIIANNILTGIGACALNYSGSAPSAAANYNLYRDNASNHCGGAVAGANDVSGNPLFVGAYDFRLQLASAAKDVGNNAEQPQIPVLLALVPSPDYDQRAGRVDGTVDIGAHEFSFDSSFIHESSAASVSGNLTTIATSPIPLVGADLLQVSSYKDGLNKGLPPAAEAHLGTWWTGSQWTIFRESGTLTFMPIGRRFHVLMNQDANPTLLHQAQAGNITANYTTMSHASLNNQATALPIVTQRFNPNSTYNNSSVGVWFDGTSWNVFNQSLGGGGAPAMPNGAAFSVLIPNLLFAPNNYAFRTTPLDSAGRNVFLDHPLLNETPCAHPQVTAVYNPNNVYVPANMLINLGPGGTDYDQYSWWLERGDGEFIPAGAAFHVLVDPQQSRRCMEDLLYTSDFE